MAQSFVPDDFVVPEGLVGPGFRLEPLGPQHNESDHSAWTSSIDHIRATPGFRDGRWPPVGGLSLAENRRDLERHADDFERRVGFTYTVLDDGGRVIGCVYIYPARSDTGAAEVRSWVSANCPELDLPLHDAVANWLATEWPFTKVRYRPAGLARAAGRAGPPRPGPYLQTVSGRWVNPFEPDPDQIELADIARALANQCRFGGHCRTFYSVAQHCVVVSELIEEEGGSTEDALAALMHDASEAYLGDLPHPIKHRSQLGAAFRQAEEPLECVIRQRFSITGPSAAIKRIDRALLATERRAFSAETWHWPELSGVEPLDLELHAWPPDEAADAFVRRFETLDARRRGPHSGGVSETQASR